MNHTLFRSNPLVGIPTPPRFAGAETAVYTGAEIVKKTAEGSGWRNGAHPIPRLRRSLRVPRYAVCERACSPSDACFAEDTLVGVGVEGLARWLSTLAALEALVVVCHLL